MKIDRPVDEKWKISSPYGERIDPGTKEKTFHRGIDFAVPVGTEVRAIMDGAIHTVGYENTENHAQGFGLRIWQTYTNEQGERIGIVYGHLSDTLVRANTAIKKGEVIGLSGNSGRSFGPHLHIGMRKWGSDQWLAIEV